MRLRQKIAIPPGDIAAMTIAFIANSELAAQRAGYRCATCRACLIGETIATATSRSWRIALPNADEVS